MINKTEISSFMDYGKVVCISNGIIEAYVTVDVGPRIIRFGYVDSQNFMRADRKALGVDTTPEYEEYFGKGTFFENLGGHRIWLSPESYPETYAPGNTPVNFELTENGAIFTPDPELANGVQKQLEIKMSEGTAEMFVSMRVTNIGEETKRFAIWGLTVSTVNGTEIIPMNTNDTGLLANRIIGVWPYTDMSDDRIYWGKKYVTLTQKTEDRSPIKLGFDLNGGKVYYVLNDEVFCKTYETLHPDATYPDGGCSFETYTNNNFIEIESLGELKDVAKGETSELTECWTLCKKPCDVDFRNDASIDAFLKEI